ncbi:MAG: endolytic transglycosylase MltG [Gammaproteobacteria bacterium]
MRSLVFKVVGVLIVAGIIALGWFWNDYQNFMTSPLNISEQGFRYELKPGMNLTKLVKELAAQGIIKKPRYILWYARLTGKANHIQVGEYELLKNDTPGDFIEKLLNGKVIQHVLTIVEGWNFKQMMDAVNNHESLSHTMKGKTGKEIMAALGYPDEHPEGRFLPDTYHFPRGLTDIEFLKRAYEAMDKYLASEWQNREVGLAVNTPYEALILASIVEKETGLASERRAIAGVFMRRLIKGMRLQTDPTVIYGMGERYKGNIRRRDLQQDTPYNTYRRSGLTPTPIAMPGRDAIHATLHPDESDALYFVSRGDGSHHFSSTLEEHNAAVIKYQLKGRKRPFSSFKNDDEKK